jgi:hypothetical protein
MGLGDRLDDFNNLVRLRTSVARKTAVDRGHDGPMGRLHGVPRRPRPMLDWFAQYMS